MSVDNDKIWVNGIPVTDNCTEPLPQDLQEALDQLRLDHLNASVGITNTPATEDSNTLFSNDFNNYFNNMHKQIAEMFAAAALAMDSKLQASSEFMKVVQDKVGPNVVIQSMVAKDGCIWINGIPIDKLIPNSSKWHFHYFWLKLNIICNTYLSKSFTILLRWYYPSSASASFDN